MRQILVFTALTSLIAGTVFGQGIVLLRGRVVSATTGEAISYATVSLARDEIATMTNEDGRFTFKIPSSGPTDSIYISHIGYQSLLLAIRSADTDIEAIALQERSVELPGVMVTDAYASQLIRKAIARIPDNYPSSPYVSYGFYRFASWYEQKILELSEAVFDVYCPDNDRAHKQFRLIKVRANQDEQAFPGVNWKPGRHPGDLMDDDIVSHVHEAPILGDEEIPQLDFTYSGLIDDDGRPAYEILFDQKDGLTVSLHKGRILIDSASLAFLLFDYIMSPKGAAFAAPPQPGTPLLQGLAMTVSYRKYGGKYYLNHVRRDARWAHLNLGGAVIDNKSIYLVTRIDTGSVRKPTGKLVENNDRIEANANKNSTRGDRFWENYNFVEAEFNVDSTLRTIRHEQ